MNAPDFIRVGGVLYRARSSQEGTPATPEYVQYKGHPYTLAALPHVVSTVHNAISAMQRALHDAAVGEDAIEQLVDLQKLVGGPRADYGLAGQMWAQIQPGILDLMGQLDGEAKRTFGRAALGLDDALSDLLKTKSAAVPTLPPYITVSTHLYRLRQ